MISRSQDGSYDKHDRAIQAENSTMFLYAMLEGHIETLMLKKSSKISLWIVNNRTQLLIYRVRQPPIHTLNPAFSEPYLKLWKNLGVIKYTPDILFFSELSE